MKIIRIINIFERNGEKLIKEIDANDLELAIIQKLFTPFDDDPLFYRPYELNQVQYDELSKIKTELIDYPLEKFVSYFEAETID